MINRKMKYLAILLVISILGMTYTQDKMSEAESNAEKVSVIRAFFDGLTLGMTSRDGSIFGEANYLEKQAEEWHQYKSLRNFFRAGIIISITGLGISYYRNKNSAPNP